VKWRAVDEMADCKSLPPGACWSFAMLEVWRTLVAVPLWEESCAFVVKRASLNRPRGVGCSHCELVPKSPVF
jgi:hypothetical protein